MYAEGSCPGWGSGEFWLLATFCPDWLPADLQKFKSFVWIGTRPIVLLVGVLRSEATASTHTHRGLCVLIGVVIRV